MSALFSKNLSLKDELVISDEEFVQLRDFIYEECGIFVPDTRTYLLENRLSNRVRQLALKSFSEYYYYLRYDREKDTELKRLFEVVTTNETSFWRNPPQIEVFRDRVLAGLIEEQRKNGEKSLRIWSAGCSTGDEPYTIAMILCEQLGAEIQNWDIKIVANDLSSRVLDAARQGFYSDYSLRNTPEELIKKYFKHDGKRYVIDESLKRYIDFRMLNLKKRSELLSIERSHVIFCRNVIIYFDDEMKKQVVNTFYDNLLSGGQLLVGHSESLHNITRTLKPEHYPGTIVYRKE
ncbi:MAG: CheR family methyltransferase [Desulfovibrio sp.]